jgi:hypothetical protein
LCSHSSLQIFHGARAVGFPTLGVSVGPPPRFYDAFPLARPDRFLSVSRAKDLPSAAPQLRAEGAILIPHGSFVEYVGAETFAGLDVPVFGNRAVLAWESDREKERQWLDSAGVPMPRRYADPSEVDGPVIVKYYGAKGGKGFYLAKNREALEADNTVAVGISVDSVPCKKAWAESLKITSTRLLSDFWPHGKVAQLYGLFRDANGFAERANVIVDEKQTVVFVKVAVVLAVLPATSVPVMVTS